MMHIGKRFALQHGVEVVDKAAKSWSASKTEAQGILRVGISKDTPYIQALKEMLRF
jgi:hypothetical protein